MSCLSMTFSNETSARQAWRQYVEAGYEVLEPRLAKGTWTLYYRMRDFNIRNSHAFKDTKEAQEKAGI